MGHVHEQYPLGVAPAYDAGYEVGWNVAHGDNYPGKPYDKGAEYVELWSLGYEEGFYWGRYDRACSDHEASHG